MKNFKRTVKQIYKGTNVAKFRTLLAEQSKWQRRETIARNKLSDVRAKLEKLGSELAMLELEKPEEKL